MHPVHIHILYEQREIYKTPQQIGDVGRRNRMKGISGDALTRRCCMLLYIRVCMYAVGRLAASLLTEYLR